MKKTKLLISVISVCFALAVLCFGVYAAHQISYDLSGTLTYRVYDVYMNVETSVYYSPTHLSQEQIYTKIDSIINSETPNYTTLGLTAESTPAGLSYYYNQEELVNGAISRNLNFAFSNEDNPKLAFFVVFTVSNHSTVPIRAGVNAPQTTPINVYSVTSGLWNKIQKGSPKRLVVAMSIENVDAPIPVTNASNYHLNLYAQNLTEAEENAPSNVYGDFIFEDGAISASRSLKSATKDLYIPSFIDGEKVTECVNFQNCKSLTSIYVPTSVELIYPNVFSDCGHIEELSLPFVGQDINGSDVFELGMNSGPNWLPRMFDESEFENSYMWDMDGDDYGYVPKSLNTVNILYGCKGISYEFYNTESLEFYIENFTIPSSVEKIEGAFYGQQWVSDELEEEDLVFLTATDGLTKYLIKASDSVTSLTYQDLAGVYYIDDSAFWDCSLTSVQIPNTIRGLASCFQSQSDLTSVVFQANSRLERFEMFLFGYCGLTSITIPSSVTYIDHYVFDHCTSLTSITVEGGNFVYDSRNGCNAIIESATNTLIAGCNNSTIPNTVTKIGDYAFRGMTGLTSISIPDSVEIIGESAFMDATSLASVSIASSVEKIEENAFSHTSWLDGLSANANGFMIVESSDDSSIKYLMNSNSDLAPNVITDTMLAGVKVIYGLSLTNFDINSITLPNTLVHMGSYIGNYRGTSLHIPSSVKYISRDVANQVNLTSITVDSNNTVYDSRNNCNAIIESATNKLVFACKNTTIPNTIVEIEEYAFFNSGITSVTIPSSVRIIRENAFGNCHDLVSLTIQNGVEVIEAHNFVYCHITSVTIPSSVKKIGRDTFYGCHQLASVTINNGVEYIFGDIFCDCDLIQSLTLPQSLKYIGHISAPELESLTLQRTLVPTILGGGLSNGDDCFVYVHSQCLLDYLEAPGWSQYADRIRPIED